MHITTRIIINDISGTHFTQTWLKKEEENVTIQNCCLLVLLGLESMQHLLLTLSQYHELWPNLPNNYKILKIHIIIININNYKYSSIK